MRAPSLFSTTWPLALSTSSPPFTAHHTPLEVPPTYSVMNNVQFSCNVLFAQFHVLVDVASGGSDDWAKGSAGIKYSYTVEMRDTGTFGFQLPAR